MSLDSLKFTEADGSIETDAAVAGHLISDLADRPSTEVPPMTAAQLKASFDYLLTHVVGPRFNDLIDALQATTDGSAGADGIGVTAIPGLAGSTVQALLESIQTAMDDIVGGAVPDDSLTTLKYQDGSVTDDKLSTDPSDILARFAAHATDGDQHVMYTGATAGTETAYTATAAGFDSGVITLLLIKAHADCGAAPTIVINGGSAQTIKPANGTSLLAGQMKLNGLYFLLWLPGDVPLMMILNPEPYTVPNALKINGRSIYVQTSAPSSPAAGDIWVDI